MNKTQFRMMQAWCPPVSFNREMSLDARMIYQMVQYATVTMVAIWAWHILYPKLIVQTCP